MDRGKTYPPLPSTLSLKENVFIFLKEMVYKIQYIKTIKDIRH